MPHDITPMRVVPDEPQAPTQGVRIDNKEFIPTASSREHDFFPDEIAKIVAESNHALRMNSARALRARVLSPAAMKDHPDWNHSAGDHKAWQIGMAAIARIAFDE
jgi:hypothetical protein